MDDIAHGLVVAAEAGGNHAGVLAAGAGEQDLAAAQDKGLRRAEASVERLLFGGREGSHINWASHVRYRTTFPIALLETALEDAGGRRTEDLMASFFRHEMLYHDLRPA